MNRPPRVARSLLRLLLPNGHRDELIGDLDEEYRRHVCRERGRWAARWWYWRQALSSLPAFADRGANRSSKSGRPSRSDCSSRSDSVRRGGPAAGRSGSAVRERGPASHATPLPWLADALADTRYALHSLRGQPAFAAAAVATLALGIGANTAIFSIANAVLLQPLSYAEPNRLVHVFEFDRGDGSRRQASWPEYLDWQRLSSSFEEIAGYDGGSRTLTGEDGAFRVPVAQVTGNFFRTLGVQPHRGRLFVDDESGPDAASLVVLPYATWSSRFGRSEEIVGDTIDINGRPHQVIGVLPESFEFSLRGAAELYLPLQISTAQSERRYMHWVDLIGRLRPGVSHAAAAEDLSTLAARTAAEVGDWHAGVSEIVVPLHDEMVAPIRSALLVLMVAVGVVLLVTCANVAGLALARSAGRSRELSIRAALGAGRARLLRQVLTECLLLSLIGGVAGLMLGRWSLSALIAGIPERQRAMLPHLRELSLDATMIGLALGLALIAGVMVGVVAAWRAAGGAARAAMREGRTVTRGIHGARTWLVGAEVMMAVVLVAGAGLLGKSLVRLLNVSPGFDPEGVLTMDVNPPGGFDSYEELFAFHREFLDRVAALPGVEGVATINQLPLSGRGNSGTFTVEGEPLVGGETNPSVSIRTVSRDYFRVVGLPLLAGRPVDERDTRASPPVVLVNQTLAERYFPDRGPLGRRIVFSFFDSMPAWEIVGIVGDERFGALDQPISPVVYFPYQQTPDTALSAVIRTRVPPLSLVDAVRAEATALDPELPIYNVATMNMIATNSNAVFLRRYVLLLVASFAVVALVLAAVGLYGVLSQSVIERTREIGVRSALGADRGRLVRMVVRQGLTPAAGGLVAGVAVSLVALRLLGTLLYEVGPTDPVVLGGVVALLAVVAAAACWLPARRAARVDPIESLRAE